MKREKRITLALFIIYLLVLTWIILFKLQISVSSLGHLRGINLIPYGESVIVNGRLYFNEIISNIIVFVPVGIYMGILNPEWSFFKKVLPIAGLSLSFEVIQYVFAIGASDITDLINNTAGGILGILILSLLSKIFGSKTGKILNVLAGLCTIFVVGFLALIIAYNAWF